MTVDDVWRRKSDEQLLAAAAALSEYTDAGRAAIVTELQRRRDAGTLDETVADAPTTAPALSAGPDAIATNVVTRLWRGDIPLVKTFWGVGVLGNLAYRAVIVACLVTPPLSAMPWLLLIVALGYIGYVVFASVTIWRSAGRYAGGPSWRQLARALVVLNALGYLAHGVISAVR
jgi:hypothetical protein